MLGREKWEGKSMKICQRRMGMGMKMKMKMCKKGVKLTEVVERKKDIQKNM